MNVSDLPRWKQAIFYAVAALAAVGLFDALQNLPIVSNCAFYADCAAAEADIFDGG